MNKDQSKKEKSSCIRLITNKNNLDWRKYFRLKEVKQKKEYLICKRNIKNRLKNLCLIDYLIYNNM